VLSAKIVLTKIKIHNAKVINSVASTLISKRFCLVIAYAINDRKNNKPILSNPLKVNIEKVGKMKLVKLEIITNIKVP
jgi:hypothetical protein